MAATVHLISGLPRSGSTLLSAILRQNPRFQAGIESPLVEILRSALQSMSASESAMFMTDDQRYSVLAGIAQGFLSRSPTPDVIFDTHRAWCSLMPVVAKIFPEARVICCVRSPAWIIDSVERLVQANSMRVPRMFGNEVTSVFARTEMMLGKQFLGSSLKALKQAWYSEHAARLIAVRYESLAERPRAVIDRLYEIIGQDRFEHDFENVAFEADAFDERLGLPGLHRVSGRVELRRRLTILPPELFEPNDREFWESPKGNPRNVVVL